MKINEIAALIVLCGSPGKIRAHADHTSALVVGGTGTSGNSDWGVSMGKSLISNPGRPVVGRRCKLGGVILALGLSVCATAGAAEGTELRALAPPAGAIWVESLGIETMTQRRGLPRVGRSIRDAPISLGGLTYPHGIGTRSISEFVIDLKGSVTRFAAMVGLDDAVKSGVGTVTFELWADDVLVASSGLIRAGDPPRLLSADLTGARVLTLLLDDGGDTSNDDEGAWGGAVLYLKQDATSAPAPYVAPPESPPAIAPAQDLLQPAIHGARVAGATPGRPFLFRIPATGQPPLRYEASGLPAGLRLDKDTGIISGSIRDRGESQVALTVRGPHGVAQRSLRIVGSDDALVRTPPMGWNSWNAWGPTVDAQKVTAAAAALERSGLAAHGFQYVVIDDGWEGARDTTGAIVPNEKFPDMHALADALHARGLKFGIYSSPGPKTCEGYAGSWQHEQQDAASYALWGVDLLKYDWCSYEDIARDQSLAELQKPYFVMRAALTRVDRDIVYSLCQYGFGDVWKWGAEVGGNLWRTSGDLLDFWSNLESVGFRQSGREPWTRPGHWNDTDMLVVGTVGWGPNLHASRLTQNEQMLHVALWALQAAPLFIGADLSRLDPFTLALLTNDEVIDVDQDELGRAAGRTWRHDHLEVWSRPLADGTIAVGLFNRGLAPATVAVRWSDLGLQGGQPVRDLWLRKDLGTFQDSFSATVPRHGVVLVKIGRPHADRT
jgi:alpha-galactosidase